jgi:uncharacterized protein (TIGR03083 family)
MAGLDYADLIVTESRALAQLGRTVDLAARVESCPEWDLADLLRHTGTAHRWAQRVVETGQPVPPKSVDRALPDDPAGLPDWLEAGAAGFVAAVAAADPDAPCWTWAGDHHVRFWPRRMAFETAVHRWDGETAATAKPTGFAVAVAVEGIDEHVANLPFFVKQPGGDGESLHLHCTDAPGEWLVRLTGDGIAVKREHTKADVALRGPASDLFLVVLGRRPPDIVETFGTPDALAAWAPVLRF